MNDHDVVLNTTGPFFKFGEPILKSAIKCNCHYLDICDDWEPTIEMLKLNDEAKAKTREVKQLEQDIKEILKEADSKKISADWGSVSMYSQKAPMRYDRDKFDKAGLDHRDFQTQGDYSPRLSITYRTT